MRNEYHIFTQYRGTPACAGVHNCYRQIFQHETEMSLMPHKNMSSHIVQMHHHTSLWTTLTEGKLTRGKGDIVHSFNQIPIRYLSPCLPLFFHWFWCKTIHKLLDNNVTNLIQSEYREKNVQWKFICKNLEERKLHLFSEATKNVLKDFSFNSFLHCF